MFRKTTSSHCLNLDLFWQQYMACQGKLLQQFYGSLCVSQPSSEFCPPTHRTLQPQWNWCRTSRDCSAYHHRRRNLPPRSWQVPNLVLCVLLRFPYGNSTVIPSAVQHLTTLLQVGPIVSGPMASKVGWRNFWWLNTALLAFTTVLCVFLFPETKYDRSFMPQNSLVSGSPLKASTEEVEASREPTSTAVTDHADPEKDAPIQSSKVEAAGDGLTHVHTHEDPWLGRGMPSTLR